MNTKRKLNSKHEFALMFLRDSALWVSYQLFHVRFIQKVCIGDYSLGIVFTDV